MPSTRSLPEPLSYSLRSHPDTPEPLVQSIEVAIAPSADGGLVLRYRLIGEIARLEIPQPRPAAPADGLWQQSCFEAFLGAENSEVYREFNFSPSGQWAVYDFATYRERQPSGTPEAVPEISLTYNATDLTLTAEIPAGLILTPLPPAALRLGLTAVVENTEGAKSYWALTHTQGQPDFHRAETFLARLVR